MKLFKKIDLAAQLLLIITGVLLPVISKGNLFYGYFLVGGWQLLSTAIHFIYRQQYYPIKQRSYYLWTLQAFILTGILLFFSFFFGYILLVFSPFLAIWYLAICIMEIKILEKKDFIHLK
jgi:hypothetical protein